MTPVQIWFAAVMSFWFGVIFGAVAYEDDDRSILVYPGLITIATVVYLIHKALTT